MPKLKSKSRAAKCFRVTSSGKVSRKKCGLNHFLDKKTEKRKLSLSHETSILKSDIKRVRRMLCL